MGRVAREIRWEARQPRFEPLAQLQLLGPAAKARRYERPYSKLARPSEGQFGSLTYRRRKASQLDAHLSGNADYADIEHGVEDFVRSDSAHQDRLAGLEDCFHQVLPGRAA